MTRADLTKQPQAVATMFDDVAGKYDLLNAILAFGQDRGWRAAMVDALDFRDGARGMVLDVAAGTGTSSAAIAAQGHRVIASDFSPGMMREGRKRQPEIPFIGADATNLPFASDSFDAAVISFGLRNVHEPQTALAEMMRVVKPGGRVVVCEFSTPTNRILREIYSNYLMKALPPLAARVSANGPASLTSRNLSLLGRSRTICVSGSWMWGSIWCSTATSPVELSRCTAAINRWVATNSRCSPTP